MATKRANAKRQIRNQQDMLARIERIENILAAAFPELVAALDAEDEEEPQSAEEPDKDAEEEPQSASKRKSKK